MRKLRWGYTLKKDAPGAYRLDMTTARFKNSRFYGPSVTSVSKLIAPALDAYVELISLDYEHQPYVWCAARDSSRCLTTSQWSAYAKAIFKKWSGVACPPKMLRASFVTWIRNTEASPEVLKQAARAMRHQKKTADSDKYDKEANDRLVQAAVAFCEAHAAKFAPAATGGAAAAPAPASADGWQLVSGQAVNYKLKATAPASDGQRPFAVQIGWLPAFGVGMTLRFPVCPGRADGLVFQLPSDASIVGKTMNVATTLDAAAVKTATVTVTSLQMQVPQQPQPAAGGGADGVAASNTRPQSLHRPPVAAADLMPRLQQLGFALCPTLGNGDCAPMAAMAGFELTPAQAAAPDASAAQAVQLVRDGAVDVLVAANVGAVDGNVFRDAEGLPTTAAACEAAMRDWRTPHHWVAPAGMESRSAAFLFGIAAHLQRAVIVLERTAMGVAGWYAQVRSVVARSK